MPLTGTAWSENPTNVENAVAADGNTGHFAYKFSLCLQCTCMSLQVLKFYIYKLLLLIIYPFVYEVDFLNSKSSEGRKPCIQSAETRVITNSHILLFAINRALLLRQGLAHSLFFCVHLLDRRVSREDLGT
jgi:hypothetical protein